MRMNIIEWESIKDDIRSEIDNEHVEPFLKEMEHIIVRGASKSKLRTTHEMTEDLTEDFGISTAIAIGGVIVVSVMYKRKVQSFFYSLAKDLNDAIYYQDGMSAVKAATKLYIIARILGIDDVDSLKKIAKGTGKTIVRIMKIIINKIKLHREMQKIRKSL